MRASEMRKMTMKQIEEAARADPDAQPLTAADLKRMKRSPQVRIIRQALGLTQEQFASRFGIPIGTLRDWEQQRKEPDQTAKTYLRVIARIPDEISRALREGRVSP
jgi:putative transcriptional regulator